MSLPFTKPINDFLNKRKDMLNKVFNGYMLRHVHYSLVPGIGNHPAINNYIKRNGCNKIMEIGVAYGDNAKKMIRLANMKEHAKNIKYFGFDKFKDGNRQKVEDELSETGAVIKLFQGDSTKTLPDNIGYLPKMDLIFIDGGHSRAVVSNDWKHSRKLMKKDTAVFFHDYYLYKGVREVVNNIQRKEFSVKIYLDYGCGLACVQRASL